MHKQNIKKLSSKQLEEFFVSKGDKAFRGRQVYDWLWKKNATSFNDMSDLSKATRILLQEHFDFSSVVDVEEQKSTDGTVKLLFVYQDGATAEGVLIPSKGRLTACISSQAGCALKCRFCATGQMGFVRNLDAAEITEQVTMLNSIALRDFKHQLSNIVLMGMGEPLMNFDHVSKSIRMITDDATLGMSPRRITLSTAGIIPGIIRLADSGLKINLAISLHAATNIKRSKLMPVNNKYDLAELSLTLKHYYKKTGQRITYEYILINHVNDSVEDAHQLAEFCKVSPCKINLIPYNGTADAQFTCSETDRIDAFKEVLDRCNLVVQVRRSKGADIMAACGQLASAKPQ